MTIIITETKLNVDLTPSCCSLGLCDDLSPLPWFRLHHSLGARPSHAEGGSGKLAYINCLWDVASLQASYAIIEGVDWVQICMCSISYCRPPLPVKILVTKRSFESTLESATATFGRQFKQPIAGKPGTVVLANEICVTCVRCGECLGYI